MDLKRREFRKTLLRVFLVSLIIGVVGTLIGFVWDSGFIFFMLFILLIYSLVEACKVFKTRAAIRDESTTQEGDYIFAGLRFVVIMIPSIAVGAWLGFVLMIFVAWENGYHG